MPQKNKIRISICIPTFNRADLLDQTLQSVASQTIKPFEVIVTDNCSTDGTDKVGMYYQKKYGFKFIKNRKNLGMIGNWNKAISLAKGDFICLLHSDDLISPHWHEIWLDTISKHTADFYTSAIAIINDKNRALFTAHIFPHDRLMQQPDTMRLFLESLSPMIAPSGASIYSKKVFKKIGLFNEQFKTEADVPHFLDLASTFNVYYKNSIVFAWRTHAAQTFDKTKAVKSVEAELTRLNNYFSIIAKHYRTKYKSSKKWKKFIQTHMFMALSAIQLHIVKGKFKKVFGSYAIAKKHFPSALQNTKDWIYFVRIQFILIRRALMLTRINKADRESLAWLQKIKIPSSSHVL